MNTVIQSVTNTFANVYLSSRLHQILCQIVSGQIKPDYKEPSKTIVFMHQNGNAKYKNGFS